MRNGDGKGQVTRCSRPLLSTSRGATHPTRPLSGLVQELHKAVEVFRREAGVGVEQQHIARRALEEPVATRD